MHRKGEEVLAGLRVDHTESSELHVPDWIDKDNKESIKALLLGTSKIAVSH